MACNGSSISLAHSCHQSARDQEVCTTYPEDSRKTLQCQVTAGVRWDEQVQQCCLSKQTSKSLVWRGKKKKKIKKTKQDFPVTEQNLLTTVGAREGFMLVTWTAESADVDQEPPPFCCPGLPCLTEGKPEGPIHWKIQQ